MKITHICLSCFYCEGYSYQENLLSIYHRRMGFDVDIIASLQSFDEDGKPCILTKTEDYVNVHGIHVMRLDYMKPIRLFRLLRRYIGFEEALERSAPDILFVHGVQSAENETIVGYLKCHPNVKLFMDNHADYSNSATNWLSRNVLHRVIWRHFAQITIPYVQKYWGVLPARVDFLVENYGLPRKKCDLLVMGADDELVAKAKESRKPAELRNICGVGSEDILIVTGGKIDNAKAQVLTLMEVVRDLADKGVKLLIFGSVVPELKNRFDELAKARNIMYAGWIKAADSYDYFEAADLVCFPGRHSVFWEQAAAQSKPLLLKHWDGYEHLDHGGNCAYTVGDEPKDIWVSLERCLAPGELARMRKAAEACASEFLYSRIAEKSVAEDNLRGTV